MSLDQSQWSTAVAAISERTVNEEWVWWLSLLTASFNYSASRTKPENWIEWASNPSIDMAAVLLWRFIHYVVKQWWCATKIAAFDVDLRRFRGSFALPSWFSLQNITTVWGDWKRENKNNAILNTLIEHNVKQLNTIQLHKIIINTIAGKYGLTHGQKCNREKRETGKGSTVLYLLYLVAPWQGWKMRDWKTRHQCTTRNWIL